MKLSEALEISTVRIECNNGSVGTGFFYSLKTKHEHRDIPFIVTNKHVIAGADSIDIHLHTENFETGKEEHHKIFHIGGVQEQFLFHPEAEVDLCALPVGPMFNALAVEKQRPKYFSFTQNELIENHRSKNPLGSIEEVHMTGYPNGLWDAVNNKPITRRGITATNIADNWQGRNEFMIDMACYPGSSGSPIYIYNNGPFTHEGNLVHGERVILLGILRAGPQIFADGEVKVIDVPTSQKIISTTAIMMNLGVIIKANELNYLSDFFKGEL
ncbi:S1 family peptidase [Lelliottia nimipressuralis]|uniref:Trypsin-like peptidase domain-containing protein n=1 Tax=Lelliottia nimipressuralis TaxID=69220 RepID=A0ABD4KD50_9ENTR|nr:serine protease [Lelliottia nimipressuralis]MBF4179343.1 trypsin-like peptidase domain-containing protein [Lelliottia nimipressuralis]